MNWYRSSQGHLLCRSLINKLLFLVLVHFSFWTRGSILSIFYDWFFCYFLMYCASSSMSIRINEVFMSRGLCFKHHWLVCQRRCRTQGSVPALRMCAGCSHTCAEGPPPPGCSVRNLVGAALPPKLTPIHWLQSASEPQLHPRGQTHPASTCSAHVQWFPCAYAGLCDTSPCLRDAEDTLHAVSYTGLHKETSQIGSKACVKNQTAAKILNGLTHFVSTKKSSVLPL